MESPKARIQLASGLVLSRPIESTDLRPATVRRYIAVDELLKRLQDYSAEWYQAARDAGDDVSNLTVDLNLLLDDMARICEIDPEDWPYLDQQR